MKSPNFETTSVERALSIDVRPDSKFWSYVLMLAVCPILFCSCQSTGESPFSSKNSDMPYAQNEPKTPEEEAYYRDVYSGDWREQTGPAGMGKSIAKKSGSTVMPPHWQTRPEGARDLTDVRAEAARRRPSAPVASNPYPLPQTSASQPATAPVAPPAPQIQSNYAAAPTQPTFASQVSYAPAAHPTPGQQAVPYVPQQSPEVVQQQAAAQAAMAAQQQQAAAQAVMTAQQQQTAAQAALAAQQQGAAQQQQGVYIDQRQSGQVAPQSAYPTQNIPVQQQVPQYSPSSYTGASFNALENKSWVVRGQEPVAEPVAMTDENVTAKVTKKAAVTLDESRPGGVAVKPVVIDPTIAAPYADVRRPAANPSAPLNSGSAPRSAQDEYVVTGGDSKDKVVSHEDWLVENLDPEDTAAHFDSVDGRILTEPSNRIFLYSPRFGAVRQIVAPIEGLHRESSDIASVAEGAEVKVDAATVDVRSQDEKLLSATGTQEVAGAQSAMAPTTSIGRVGVIEADGQLRLHEMLTSATVDELGTEDSALMMDGAIAAQGWSDKKGVAVATDQTNVFSNVYLDGPATVYAVKDGTTTSKLRVVKIANKDAARPGEFVEFTLRFENIGDEPIGNVTILDNLSARLRYVDGTAKSSVKTDFFADLSETGSLVLRWEIADPLQPKEFGVVRFICKVQ